LVAAGGKAAFADLAAEIVTSRQFRYRRGRDDANTETVRSGAAED
jgi:hypothetical protein